MKKDKKAGKQPKQKSPGPGMELPLTILQQDLLAMGLFILVILALYSAVIFKGYIYEGGDTIENLTQTHKINEYYKATGDTPFWNPYPEAGTPNVFHLPTSGFTPGFILDKLGGLLGTTLLYFLLGAAGMYFLLKHMRFGTFISFTATLFFILAPYYKSLIIVGQYLPAKFEAVMLIPWIVWTFLLCFERAKLLYALLLALALGLQFQTQHYQVVYYTAVILVAIGAGMLVNETVAKRYAGLVKKVTLWMLAGLFALLSAAYPLFPAREFNQYTIRARHALDISKEQSQKERRAGVDPEFVKSWSMAPREFLDLLVPRASGGTTNEKYEGAGFPELNGRVIPAYWGNMLFSGSLIYLGIPVLLSLLALFRFRDGLVAGLGFSALIMFLWALGLNFRPFYELCSAVLPFFKNFRTPPASLAVIYFILAVLSAYGLKYLLNDEHREDRVFRKRVLWSLAGFLGLGLVLYLVGGQLGYSKGRENFEESLLPVFQKIRRSFYFQDLARYMMLVAAFSAIVAAWLFRKIRQNHAILLVCALVAADLLAVQSRHPEEPVTRRELEQKYFPSEALTAFFAADRDNYRVYAYSQSGKTYTSAVQTIQNNFDLQTLVPVYELFINNLLHTNNDRDHINWNALRIFAVKYLVFDQQMDDPQLTGVFSNPERNEFVYTYRNPLPFGHFVQDHRVITGDYDRLKAINDSTFDPSVIAILEENPGLVEAPGNTSAIQTVNTPSRLGFDVSCDRAGLFVMSVPYVPGGWTAFIDGKPAGKIYQANHAMQAVVVPAGRHGIRLEFRPPIFASSLKLSTASTLALYSLILLLAFFPAGLKKRLRLPDWLA